MPRLNLSEDAINKYLDHIRTDYSKWTLQCGEENPIRTNMINEFNASLRYEVGSKYIKIIRNNGVHSFIVNDLKGKFPLGSILKAASWRAPATNFKRGCVLAEQFSNITWTGAI